MIKDTRYYREPNGDYLVIWGENGARPIVGGYTYDGRATAIAGNVGSVQGTVITSGYLKRCRRVAYVCIPVKWRVRLNPAK